MIDHFNIPFFEISNLTKTVSAKKLRTFRNTVLKHKCRYFRIINAGDQSEAYNEKIYSR